MSNNESNERLNSNLEKTSYNANQIMKLAQNNLNDVKDSLLKNIELLDSENVKLIFFKLLVTIKRSIK